MHRDLVVARVRIKEGYELMVSCCIHYLINTEKGKSILRASIIDVRIIGAHAPLAILLRNNHDIGKPLEVLNPFYEANDEEFVHFLFYDFLACWVKSPQFLTYMLALIPKIQVMLNLSRRNVGHVGVGPCKNINELLHK